MRSLVLLLFIFHFNEGVFAQQKNIPAMEVISLNAKMYSFYSNGQKEDFGQDMKIAFFKEHVLFEQQVIHHKASSFHTDIETIENGVTTLTDTSSEMTIEKITYLYYVYKVGDKKGLLYDEYTGKTKSFSLDTLYTHSNLGQENEESINLSLGKPNEVKKQGKKWTEKYYNFKDVKGLDTVFRVYDDALKDFPFSISKKLDQEKNSKLIKSLQIVKMPPSVETKRIISLKLEILTEIELVTQKTTKQQLEKFAKYFEKYQQDVLKNPITER